MDKPVIRMSSSGNCPRALSAELLGHTPTAPPAWLETAAEEGRWHEQRIKDELVKEGWFINSEQKEVKLEFPSFDLVGHIDGAAMKNREWSLLEIKSMSQYEFDRWMKEGFRGFGHYAAQITCYMEATRLKQCLYAVKNRSSGYIHRQILDRQPMPMTEIIGRITDATNHAMANQLALATCDPQSLECRRCNYKQLCILELEALTPAQESELSEASAVWRKGTSLVKEGQELVDSARLVFDRHTRATVTRWQYSRLAIQMIHTKRESYEKKELLKLFTTEQLLPALKVTEYDMLRITDMNKEEDND